MARPLPKVLSSFRLNAGGLCDGSVVFTSAGAVLRLQSAISLASSLTLDASGLSSPATLLPPIGGGRHAAIDGTAVRGPPLPGG